MTRGFDARAARAPHDRRFKVWDHGRRSSGMGDLTVRPWQRYGKSRLYVNDTDGSRVGWHDLQTGVSTIERTDLADAFTAALGPYLSGEPERAEVTDLADRRPGEGVRAEAEAAWQARKDKSRLIAYAGRLLDAKTDERAWRRGAEGEEAVGAALEKLSSVGWRTLNSVPVGRRGSDIDHVVIGPGGVFTLNAKNHRGKRVHVSSGAVWVTGQRKHYVRNSAHEALRASRLLTEACGVPVLARGVVVILADQFRRKGSTGEVTVLASGELRAWLKKRPQILDERAVASIFEQARRAEVWTQ